MLWAWQRTRLDRYAFFALLLTLFAWAPLLSPLYFLEAHDAAHSLFFPLQFHQGIQEGYWLPRWGADFAHGYGYPILIFYAPLSFYIWESFHASGLFGVVASSKATFVIGFLLAAAGCYAYVRTLWGRQAALLAAVVYTYLPYHLLNIYVRAAMAEFMGMALVPWVALAFHHLVQRPGWRRAALAAASYGALIWTHNLTALLFSPLLGALLLFEIGRLAQAEGRPFWGRPLLRHSLPVAGSILLGVLLGSAIWLPAMSEQRFIKIEQWALETYRYEDHFVYPAQLLSPFWGFGYSTPGPQDGMSFQLGAMALLLAGLGLLYFWQQRARAPHPEYALFYAVAFLVLVGLMLPASRPLWDLNPLATLVQFPWRLLAVSAFPLAILAGGAARFLDPALDGVAPGLALALLLVVVSSAPYSWPPMIESGPRQESQQVWRDYERKHPDMVAMVAQTEQQPADSPLLAALEANEPPMRFEALDPTVTVEPLYLGASRARARVRTAQPATIRYLSYWYPGWQATLDGTPLPIEADGGPLGLMQVEVPRGEHLLAFDFADPPLRRLANSLSLGSLLLVGGLAVWGSWKENRP